MAQEIHHENYIDHLKERLAAVDRQIAKARARLESGEAVDKVKAAGGLAFLEEKRDRLSEKLDEAAAHHAEDWSASRTTLNEDFDALSNLLEAWIVKH